MIHSYCGKRRSNRFRIRMATSSNVILLLMFIAVSKKANAHDEDLHLTILHTSDVSSRFEQFDSNGNNCTEEQDQMGLCFGGVARRGTIIKQVRNERDDINVLLLDAGDQFVGTWFTFFRGEATAYFMNRLGYDAMTFGNLEFVHGPDVLAPFLDIINFDMVSANLNITQEPVLHGLFNKSTVVDFNGQLVGIVGYTHEQVNIIASLRNAIFTNVIEAVQAEVDVLTSQGIDKIIVLSHSWGSIDKDVEVARVVKGVDVIVGGGQNHFHYSGCAPDVEVPLDDYPIEITPDDDPEGTVLIVHGTVYAKYLGRLNVIFDDEGKVSEWYGNPILLDENVEQDPELLAEIIEYRQGILDITDRVVGRSLVHLQGSPRDNLVCRQKECNLGNLIADSMIWHWLSSYDDRKWTDLAIAVINAGGIRSSIDKGEILFREITDVLPFGGTVDALQLHGRYIREMLEHSVANYPIPGSFLQVSGMRVTYDVSRDPYDGRVVEVQVLCTECNIPEFSPLEDDRLYRIALPAFMASGGDGYTVIRDNAVNHTEGGVVTTVLAEYIERFSPIYIGIEGRITFID